MAFITAIRVVVQLEIAAIPAEIAAYRWVASGGSTSTRGAQEALSTWWSAIVDPDTDPDELSSQMSVGGPESETGVWVVTDFTGTFELRRLQWRFSRAPSGGLVEDQDTVNWHFIKASGGVPGTYVDSTDLPAVEAAANTLWTASSPFYKSWMHSDQFRWYKDGPAYWHTNTAGDKVIPIVPNPAIRITEVDVPGSLSGTTCLPPQLSISVTKKTSSRKNWGRIFFPVHSTAYTDNDGRLVTSNADTLCGLWVAFCNTCRAASMIPVVFSIPKLARATAGGGELAAQAAMAFEVNSIQVDNLFDVIRSRRYSGPTYRKVTALTQALGTTDLVVVAVPPAVALAIVAVFAWWVRHRGNKRAP